MKWGENMIHSNRHSFLFLAVFLFITICQVRTSTADPSDAQKLQLKATILEHIESLTADGTYYFVDASDTALMKLTFVAMHPVVFERTDGTFALCADFNDGKGKKVLIDYYVKNLNGKFVVLSSLAGKRSLLMKIAEKFNL